MNFTQISLYERCVYHFLKQENEINTPFPVGTIVIGNSPAVPDLLIPALWSIMGIVGLFSSFHFSFQPYLG